ncbi:uncharacterized protein TNCV_2007711 [Trichonephila clavipes]|nr:uncharacterized protein TNCV_2007711 [Trichonephila clavipes]
MKWPESRFKNSMVGLQMLMAKHGRPTAVNDGLDKKGLEFESRRRHGCLWHGGTLNNHRATSPLVRLEEGEERWEAYDHPKGVLPQNWGRTEQNSTVTRVVLKAKANDRRKNLALHRDEFRGP